MISWPFHCISPPGGTGMVSLAGATASARPALTFGPIIPLITLMNMTIQRSIKRSIVTHAIVHTTL